ncbi:hypothetical protein ACFSKW_39415 [Nonomuraea mangrovi]|uniref:Helix-turn-helix transcriptional regulator n=1 Tax=Nonomuraea mangrovi TaxID=2316207 RepID=A0ABW4T8H1_9ACTN
MATVNPLVAELDALRVELGVAEQIVAEVVGVDPLDVGWWATGLRTPSLREFVGYAALLGRRFTFANEHGQIEYVDQVPILGDDNPPERLRLVLERRRERREVSRRAVANAVGVSPPVFNRCSTGGPPASGRCRSTAWSAGPLPSAGRPASPKPPRPNPTTSGPPAPASRGPNVAALPVCCRSSPSWNRSGTHSACLR